MSPVQQGVECAGGGGGGRVEGDARSPGGWGPTAPCSCLRETAQPPSDWSVSCSLLLGPYCVLSIKEFDVWCTGPLQPQRRVALLSWKEAPSIVAVGPTLVGQCSPVCQRDHEESVRKPKQAQGHSTPGLLSLALCTSRLANWLEHRPALACGSPSRSGCRGSGRKHRGEGGNNPWQSIVARECAPLANCVPECCSERGAD